MPSNTDSSFRPIALNSASLHYLHPPPSSSSSEPPKSSDDGKSATLLTADGTDWWHTPERDSQDGLAWGKWIDLLADGEGFEVRVKASIKEKNRPLTQPSDQACLFVYLSQHCWIKAGVEYDMGKLWDGAVVCNPFSDWAITPAKEGTTYTISYHPASSHLRVFLDDVMVREVNSFAAIPGYTPALGEDASDFDKKFNDSGKKVFVGIMGCSPLGGGSEARFEGLEYRQGVRPKA